MGPLAWAATLLIVLLMPPGPGVEWRSFDSLEATYTWSYHNASGPFEGTQQGTKQLWYQAPDHYRLEQTFAGSSSSEAVTVVGDADGARVYTAQQRVVMWTPAGNATADALGMDRFDAAGRGGPFASFQQEVSEALSLTELAQGGWQRLPDEVVAGRKATVLVQTTPAAEERAGPPAEFTVKYRVDQEYGILLGEDDVFPGVFESSGLLTSLHVNPKLDRKLFQLDVPAGVITIKGPFPGLSAPDLGSDWDEGSLGMDVVPELPEGVPPTRLLAPGALPSGFVTFSFTQNSVEDRGKPDATWSATVPYVNPGTGGFIQFTQGTSDEVRPQEEANVEMPVTVRESPATLYHYDQPYPHLALVWTAGGLTYSLEGSEVTLAQLQAMAEGMKPVTPKQTKPGE